MKFFLLASLVVLAAARPQQGKDASIVRMESTQNDDGSFKYGFETTDPIVQDVVGQIKQIGDEFGVVMQGSFDFVTPEGKAIRIDWVADENGFQPVGEAIPKDA